MNRQNQILAAIFAIQIVVLIVVFWPEKSVARGERLFGELEVDQVAGMVIRDGTGQEIHITQGPEGWVLPEADDYPVLQDKVLSLLAKLIDLRADRLVTRTTSSHKRLGVADEDFERLVELEMQNGDRHRLFLGTSPRYQVLHVRADDQDQVYLALGLSASDVSAGVAPWIDTTYFSVPQAEIMSLILTNQNGRFEFTKDDAGNWVMSNLPEGKTLIENNVISLVTRISTLRLLRPLGREEQPFYGLNEPSAVITVQTRDDEGIEKTFIVRVGATLEGETGYVVKSATSPYYVLVSDYTVGDFIERTLEDFVEAPPTPTPEASPAP